MHVCALNLLEIGDLFSVRESSRHFKFTAYLIVDKRQLFIDVDVGRVDKRRRWTRNQVSYWFERNKSGDSI